MTDNIEKASSLCGEVQKLALDTTEWLNNGNNKALVGDRWESLMRQMRQTVRQANRLKIASESPVTIAVYGASQAGKSFLVAHLAAPPLEGPSANGNSAMVLPHARNGAVSFLEINPTGGRESTGLVTRFTSRNIRADGDFPILIRLLTVLDLVKILSSCYFIDLEQSEEAALDGKDIETLLAGLSPTNSISSTGLIGDDVYELKDYFRQFKHLRNNTSILDAAQYWERLAEHVGHLSCGELTTILEPLWGKVPGFSAIFRRLYESLHKIGFSEEIFCGMDALLPRVDAQNPDRALTIIDVDTLKRLLNDEHEPLQVKSGSSTIILDRAVITALAAELVLNIAGAKQEFLEKTDLLDFPGARSRGGTRRSKLEEPGEVESIYLRGKVAHLFDRYRDEYDLTSMILCVGPSTQEVTTLPKLINEWVEATHGETPTQRQKADTALFLVLTQFDRQFIRQAGEQMSMGDRWINRLNATIGGFLARDGNWAREWHPNAPFNNIFWYRNPFVDQKHLFDYVTSGSTSIESGLRRDAATYVEEMKSHYVATELVKKHFFDPQKAWDAVFKLNDGGISYLSEAITRISKKNVKIGQIENRARLMAEHIKVDLSQYFFDTDPTIQLKTRQRKAEQFLSEIENSFSMGQFSRLIAEIQVREDEFAQIFRAVRLREGHSFDLTSSRATGNLLARALGRGNEKDAKETFLDCKDVSAKSAEIEERFACRVMSTWLERVDQVCQNRELIEYIGLSPSGIQFFASELAAGTRRLNYGRTISDQVREYVHFRQAAPDLGAWSPALKAASAINRFTVYFDSQDDSMSTPDRDWPELGENPARVDEEFCVSWMQRFFSFVESNAQTEEGTNFDVVQNSLLSEILMKAEHATLP
jgi:hypothetical protein